jgi:Tol biopolymer transport system component
MRTTAAIFITLLFFSVSLKAQKMVNSFSGQDIGNPKLKGSFQYDEQLQKYSVSGAGYNLWFERDEFYFVSQKIDGDFIITCNLNFLGEGVDAHRKIGLMIRNSEQEDAVYMDGAIHGDGLTSLQYRQEKGAATLEKAREKKEIPEVVQLERKGDEFIFRISINGSPMEEVGKVNLKMNPSVLTGMFVSSHNVDVIEKAEFWNVRIEKPAASGVDGYQSPSPSRLEILDVETGFRNLIYETNQHIEAPNWSRDGKFLIYNSGGKLYKFDLTERKPEWIDTDFATSNNNDHGISFDGKQLAISHHLEENGQSKSIIYTVPIGGGTPKRITENGPSYWHGWSPDDKWLTYCAERNGNYDVYKIPAKGGKEIRLTTAEGLDDGPEYSPDGKNIYFNSVRSGMMQIWRMKPDGTEQEQVTSDGFQDWFAHPSPDGKWLIMISYLPEVPANSHPHNKHVMLRLMDVKTKSIKSVAFLYGGQGTFNVPSWSPDSKKVAFVSYTY